MKRIAISILKNSFLCNVFPYSKRSFFDKTCRFYNDFYIELEEAVFR